MSDQAPAKTPEPVRKLTLLIAGIVLALTQVAPAAEHFGWFHLTSNDLNYIGQIAGAATAFALVVGGMFVRDQVTPTVNVALTKDEAQVLAPLAPGGIVGNNVFEQTRFNQEGPYAGPAYGPAVPPAETRPTQSAWPVGGSVDVPPPEASPKVAKRAPRPRQPRAQ